MAKDPYKYFRIEARELVDALKQGALDLEKGASKEVVARLLRHAHTLKGAARVVKLPSIAEQAHAIEDALEPHREGGTVERATIDAILKRVDVMAAAVASLKSEDEVAKPVVVAEVAAVETVRIEIEEMDRLLNGLVEATVQLNTLRQRTAKLPRAYRLEMGAAVEQVGVELLQVRDAATRLRLTPVSRIFATLERAVRDAAQSLGKTVRFDAHGGDTRLDAHVLGALGDALLQIVRNAVAHGIDRSGTVTMRVERRGNKVAFACTDDGRGLDLIALRRAAITRGVARDGTTERELLDLLLAGGLTTTSTITEVSGRGVGLDVVREIASRLKGEVTVRTTAGRGTTFEICVPVSLTSQESLVVSASGVTGSVPLESVRSTLRLAESEIAHTAGSDSVVYSGNVIPFAPLARLLGKRDAPGRRRTAWSAVVVQSGAALAAIGVDELLGTSEVIVRALPHHLEARATVAGASLDAEGNPELVFDPAGLVAAASASRASEGASDIVRRPILVVDDSLTTRMLEQSILESAGYDVELATSAEEALEMAKNTRYGVFVVDVEMPGIDGFEFVTRTRADAELRNVPAILVTSRNSDSDKKRGLDAGASAYIVKGEFDQALLLRTISALLGVGK